VSRLWDLLGQKYAIDVLIYVYRHPGEMQKTIIECEKFGRTSRLERLVDLVKAGFIREETAGGNWIAIRYSVTEEGAKVARGLCAIEEVMPARQR